uniref:Uncharacterized protein n=1 Tax=Siphoviridae sp. ct3UN6 TaxID=2827769 RepID=A0A8S5S4B6_9CAUD|nr:MAG TPA: hypothetical protein [Siphoviridae sp. ct3UN6]
MKSPGNGRGVSRTKSQFQTGYIGPRTGGVKNG